MGNLDILDAEKNKEYVIKYRDKFDDSNFVNIKKLAIVGSGQKTAKKAPYADEEWHIWGLNYNEQITRFSHWFELHDYQKVLKPIDDVNDNMIINFLQENQDKLYTRKNPLLPNANIFPIEQLIELYKIRYFTCTVSMLIAFAIAYCKNIEEIALYGIDCAVNSEYAYEKPSVEFWLGLAIGRGIKITLPENCELLRSSHIYAYESNPIENSFIVQKEKELIERKKDVEKKKAEIEKALAYYDGALALSDYVKTIYNCV